MVPLAKTLRIRGGQGSSQAVDKQLCSWATALQFCIFRCWLLVIVMADNISSKPASEQFVCLEVLIHFCLHICPTS